MRSLSVLTTFFCIAALQLPGRAEPDKVLAAAQALLAKDRVKDAETILAKAIEADGAQFQLRKLLAEVLSHQGELEKAALLMEAGSWLEKATDDEKMRAWWMAGNLRSQQGEDGPNCKRTGGTVTISPSKISDEEEQAWSQAKYSLAAENWRKFHKLKPKHERGAERLADSLQKWAGKDAAVELEALYKEFPDSLPISLSLGKLLLGCGKHSAVLELASFVLSKQPHAASAYGLKAEALAKLGKTAEAAEAKQRQEFHQEMPEFCALDYSAENTKLIADLKENPKKTSERLMGDKTAESSRILALLCYLHLAHGPVEEAAFAELTSRKEEALLLALAEEGQSLCTFRGCSAALAKLKTAGAFEVILRFLEGDNDPIFSINAAQALATLGDVRAVPELIRVLAPKMRESERQLGEDEADFVGYGKLRNRQRSALALASFDTPESREALLLGAKNDDIKAHCHTALFKLTKDEDHLAEVKAAIAKEPSHGALIPEFLDDLGLEVGKKLAKEILAEQKVEEERRKKEK
jgi:hypothetical protein